MNKDTRNGKGVTMVVGCIVAMLVVTSGQSFAGTTTADTWAATGAQGSVTVSGLGTSAATANFPENYGIGAAVTLEPQSASATFLGNYSAAGASELAFTLEGETPVPANACVILLSGSGNTWLARGLALGANSVSLDQAAGGWTLAYDFGQAADFASDLSDVVMVGVRLQRANVAGDQSYTISGLSLSSDHDIGGSGLSLEDALYARFGVRSIGEVPDGDGDGDGMSDLDEFLAEYDNAYFAENLFKANVRSAAEGIYIEFACVGGQSYTVIRSATVDSLIGGQIIAVVEAPETGYMEILDTDPGDGPNYYNVKQD